jgi:hypothetical protein
MTINQLSEKVATADVLRMLAVPADEEDREVAALEKEMEILEKQVRSSVHHEKLLSKQL